MRTIPSRWWPSTSGTTSAPRTRRWAAPASPTCSSTSCSRAPSTTTTGHFEPLQKAGANLNGSTTTDRTNYWEDVPSNYLELALWLEADRMGFLLDGLDQQKFDVQRDVVKNERRQSYENRPYGMAHGHLQSALFPLPHPYHWMTIGSQEDLDSASLDDVKEFFQRFYGPSNASLAIAGDFHAEEALELVSRYFGDLPPGESVPRIGRAGLAPVRPRRHRDARQGDPARGSTSPGPPPPRATRTTRLWNCTRPSCPMASVPACTGPWSTKSRSHSTPSSATAPSEIAGQLMVQVTAAEGHNLDEIEAAVEAELEDIHRNPPTDEEIARSKNRIEATHFRQLARIGGFGGRADQLNHFNVIESDPGLINTSLDRCLVVQREDILRVAETYVSANRVRLRVLPETPLSAAATTVDRNIMPPPSQEPTFTAATARPRPPAQRYGRHCGRAAWHAHRGLRRPAGHRRLRRPGGTTGAGGPGGRHAA